LLRPTSVVRDGRYLWFDFRRRWTRVSDRRPSNLKPVNHSLHLEVSRGHCGQARCMRFKTVDIVLKRIAPPTRTHLPIAIASCRTRRPVLFAVLAPAIACRYFDGVRRGGQEHFAISRRARYRQDPTIRRERQVTSAASIYFHHQTSASHHAAATNDWRMSPRTDRRHAGIEAFEGFSPCSYSVESPTPAIRLSCRLRRYGRSVGRSVGRTVGRWAGTAGYRVTEVDTVN